MATGNFLSINVGSTNNARDGDTLRSAFQKINQNFSEIDDLIDAYFQEFLSQPNLLPTDIKPVTPDTSVNISSTGTGLIILNAPTVEISNDINVNGSMSVFDKFTAFGDAEFKGNVEFDGNVSFNDVSLLGAKIDCGKF